MARRGPQKTASVAMEAANILGVSGAEQDVKGKLDTIEAKNPVKITLSLPRPIVACAERLVSAGLAKRREDLLLRWLIDSWQRSGKTGETTGSL